MRIKNGWLQVEGHLPGDKAVVGCNKGYQVSGQANILVCQMNLEWTPDAVQCVPVRCGKLPTVANAAVQAAGFNYLDIANYSCLPGYEMRVGRKYFYNFSSNSSSLQLQFIKPMTEQFSENRVFRF